MKKDDRFPQNDVTFEDAQYAQDMRVDPLTTTEAVKAEVEALNAARKERHEKAEAEKKAEAVKQAEADKAELEALRAKYISAKKAEAEGGE
jgi:regulator of protease activity HflC (stomatin/prohibitin superfamily)